MSPERVEIRREKFAHQKSTTPRRLGSPSYLRRLRIFEPLMVNGILMKAGCTY